MKITPTFSNGLLCTIVPTDDLGRAYPPLPLDLGDEAALAGVVATLATTFPVYAATFDKQLRDIRADRQRSLRKSVANMVAQYRPFPLEVLPGPVANYIQAMSTLMDSDASLIAMPMLSVLGAAIGNSAVVRVNNSWESPAAIWTAIIGESGGMKTPSLTAATRFINEKQHGAMMSFSRAQKQYNEQYRGKKDAPPRPKLVSFLLRDTTIEALSDRLGDQPRGLLVTSDELDAWFGCFDRYNGGSSDRAKWLELFNAHALQIDRKSQDLPSIYVPRAFVAITGGIQPGVLAKRLNQDANDSGLTSRLLFTWPPRRVKRFMVGDIDMGLFDGVRAVINNLYANGIAIDTDGIPQPAVIRLSPEAMTMFMEFYNAHNQTASEFSGTMASAYSKLEGYCLRFALVLHLSRQAAGELSPETCTIDGETMRRAIVLEEWCRYEMHRVVSMLKETESDRAARTRMDSLRAAAVNGEVTVRDWQRKNQRRFKSASDAELDLRLVVDAGLAVWVDNATGGRPVRAIRLVDQATPVPVPMAIAA